MNFPDIGKKQTAMICIALVAITLAVYTPLLGHGFVSYDDPEYIVHNEHVNSGLTVTNLAWAFQIGYSANWHPLTWISHMADCQLFGLNPAGHHFVDLLFHVANTLLLFVWLNSLTRATWRSAFVAALFAWHPMHVESVAWASERKDVLSAFFFFLTLLSWSLYAKDKKPFGYFLALLFFACGLMSKPMVVTLPFVLLLLDFWPLKRVSLDDNNLFRRASILLAEKLPFFALSIASSLVTCRAQNVAMWSSDSLTFHLRLENIAMAYIRYISKIFWPTDLALIYPYPHHWPLAGVFVTVALLVMLTAIFIFQAKHFPYLAVGWLWFLGTLVPVIGFVQVGIQSMADRYSYLPSIGLFILVAWGVNDLIEHRPHLKKLLPVAATLALVGLLGATSIQLTYWRNAIALFGHTIEVTTDNYAAYECYATALESVGKRKEAEQFYAEAVRVEPDFPLAQFDWGLTLLAHGDFSDASNHLAEAVRLFPRDPTMQYDFATFQLQHGDPKKAAEHFRAALTSKPDFAEARQHLEQLGETNLNRSTP